MEIIIDMRETQLYNICSDLIKTNDKFNLIQLTTSNLSIGDIIIKYSGEEKIIIERKTITDLISSIKDKRYEEQSFRLNELNHPNHNIVYLIEGNVEKYIKQKQMIYSSLFSIQFYKGFSTIRSFHINESAYIICNMILKIHIENNKPFFYLNDGNKNETNCEQPQQEENKEYCGLIMKKKNSLITRNNISEIMLCQIPNISKITAIEIFKKYQDLPTLIMTLKENPDCLDNITYQTDKNKTRKLNKTIINNIKNFLL